MLVVLLRGQKQALSGLLKRVRIVYQCLAEKELNFSQHLKKLFALSMCMTTALSHVLTITGKLVILSLCELRGNECSPKFVLCGLQNETRRFRMWGRVLTGSL